jgi:hypothetical protein
VQPREARRGPRAVPRTDAIPAQREPPAPSGPRRPLARLLAAWALAGLPAVALATLVCRGIAARAGEPLVLAWLRTCAEHPLRTSVAIGLLVWALLPGPRVAHG